VLKVFVKNWEGSYAKKKGGGEGGGEVTSSAFLFKASLVSTLSFSALISADCSFFSCFICSKALIYLILNKNQSLEDQRRRGGERG